MQSMQPWLKPERRTTVNCPNISHVNESAIRLVLHRNVPMGWWNQQWGRQSSHGAGWRSEDEDGGGEGLQLLDYSLDFCQNDVVPTELESAWEPNGKLDSRNEREDWAHPNGKIVIPWHHDEAIFYANDQTQQGWYHKYGPAKPYNKGEGTSLMVGEFVCAKFEWLQLPDGKILDR